MKDMQRDTTLNNELEFPELDLHGHPIHPAWLLFKEFVIECDDDKCNRARIITGRGKMLRNSPHGLQIIQKFLQYI